MSVTIVRCLAKRRMMFPQCRFCGQNEDAVDVSVTKHVFWGVCTGFNLLGRKSPSFREWVVHRSKIENGG